MTIILMLSLQAASNATNPRQAIADGNSANWGAVAAIAAILSAIVAAVGIWLILRQIAENRRQMRGQLISDLEDQFHKHSKTYQRFAPGSNSVLSEANPLGGDEISDVCNYLSFFEKIYLLIDEGMIDLGRVDKLFAYRFFRVVNDPYAQREILYKPELRS